MTYSRQDNLGTGQISDATVQRQRQITDTTNWRRDTLATGHSSDSDEFPTHVGGGALTRNVIFAARRIPETCGLFFHKLKI